jgi:hypothetical protein
MGGWADVMDTTRIWEANVLVVLVMRVTGRMLLPPPLKQVWWRPLKGSRWEGVE